MFASSTTRTTPRNTRITSRTIRTTPISSPPWGGLLICMVLMVLEVILVVLGVVLVVLEVVLVLSTPRKSDNYKKNIVKKS